LRPPPAETRSRLVTVVLPDIIYGYASLNLTIALVATSGSGRGGSTSVAATAVRIGPLAFQTHTLGSGQGIAHGYGHWDTKTKTVERHAESVLFTVEEVDHLAGLNAQTGSTTLAELRRFGIGEKLGHLFVDPSGCRSRRTPTAEPSSSASNRPALA
jgi:hypothetical protein